MTGAFIRRREDTGTEEIQRRPCKDKGKDWNNVATKQGTPTIAEKSRSWEEAGKHSLLKPRAFGGNRFC